MAQYIDKGALVAEIERRLYFDNNWIEGDKRRQIHTNGVSTAYYKRIGSKHACGCILDFINTLEVKEVDLEKEINEYICNNFFGSQTLGFFANRTKEEPNDQDIVLCAKHFFELGLKAQKGKRV